MWRSQRGKTAESQYATGLFSGLRVDRRILKAYRFTPEEPQEGLQPIDILGNARYRIDPYRDDFYKRLIELRAEVKKARKAAKHARDGTRAKQLEAQQQAIKIIANATSYGIFVELNVVEHDRPQAVRCHGNGDTFPSRQRNIERPGQYFHPLLST